MWPIMRFRATNSFLYIETSRETAVPVTRDLASGGPPPPFEEQPDSRPRFLPAMDILRLKAMDRAPTAASPDIRSYRPQAARGSADGNS